MDWCGLVRGCLSFTLHHETPSATSATVTAGALPLAVLDVQAEREFALVEDVEQRPEGQQWPSVAGELLWWR